MDNGHKNGHHKPVIPDDNHAIPANNHVIPAKAGASADGTSIQGKTKRAAFPSPSRSARGRAKRSDGAGDARGGNADQQPNLDVDAARASMNRMANIFADIAKHAEVSTQGRCPYKNAQSHCTAKFGCDNQHFTKNPLDPPICTARDGDLDYRSAWQI